MRVLVSERDRLLRQLIAEWLAEGGATAVASGDEELPTAVDAILVDVSCQQDAHATLASWRRAYPAAVIVLASARFAPRDLANDAMAARLGVTGILPKPFSRDALWSALGLPKTAPRAVR
ncbi:MAG: response regulator [Gammaproteobacteria bacterium]|nr:response regulator [Gammaproteobacteria bacterium]MBV9697311.1 response regulator [Gammaproteobacteria bacterium]